jgi:hypothetical protein
MTLTRGCCPKQTVRALVLAMKLLLGLMKEGKA